jgi:hypothetical protein
MKKGEFLAVFQILILFVAIVAFADVVGAYDTDTTGITSGTGGDATAGTNGGVSENAEADAAATLEGGRVTDRLNIPEYTPPEYTPPEEITIPVETNTELGLVSAEVVDGPIRHVPKDGERFKVNGKYYDSITKDGDVYKGTRGGTTEVLGAVSSLGSVTSMLKGNNVEKTVGGEAVKKTGLLSKITKKPGTKLGGIAQGAMWGAAAYGAIKLLGPMVTDNQNLVDSLATSLGAGIAVGRTVTNLGASSTAGLVAGGAVTVGIFLATYKKKTTEIIQFSCMPWEAPIGGEMCQECNKQGLPCSEYQCRSLGQACQLLNPGTSEETCAWLNRGDVKPPVITPWIEALLIDFSYRPGDFTSPGDRGAKISYDKKSGGCVPAYTPLSFGINTDEPARCRIDYERKQTFAEMKFDFGGNNLFRYNHSQVLNLPGPSVAEDGSPVLENDGEFELFVRCIDANGNGDPTNRLGSGEGVENTASFVFQFCVDPGPDTTPPIIIDTDIRSGMPIAYETTSTDIKLYTNEPSSCRWSRRDQDYGKMEQDMECKTGILEMNARMVYECETTLTGMKDRQENQFYFRCEDQPNMPENDRYQNQQSYPFSLIGTQPLVLSEVGPSGLMVDSTDVIQVILTATTTAGYEEGKSTCEYYTELDEAEGREHTGFDVTYTADGAHSQELFLPEGDYSYFIRCVDLGGNSDMDTIEFSVKSDRDAPMITRAYHEEDYLKLVTSESGECVYGTDSCNYLFEDGIQMTVVDETNHFTDWDTRTNSYIKCQDVYGNQPHPAECSLIARATEDFT